MTTLSYHEKRRHPRFPRSWEVQCAIKGLATQGLMLNMSRSGALLRLHDSLPINKVLTLGFPNMKGRSPTLKGRVVRCIETPSYIFSQVAIQFVGVNAKVSQFISQLLNNRPYIAASSSRFFSKENLEFTIRVLLIIAIPIVLVVLASRFGYI